MARSRMAWRRMRFLGGALAAGMLVMTLPAAAPAMARDASSEGLCPADHPVPAPRSDAEPTTTPTPVPAAEHPAEPAEARSGVRKLGGSWRELPRSPFWATNPVAVWAEDRMVAIDYVSGRTATYDPPIRRWEEHQPIPGGSPAGGVLDFARVAWTGDEVIAHGGRTGRDSHWVDWYAFDPASGRWRDVALPPLPGGGLMAWGDGLLFVVGGRSAAAYDPAADCWLEMPIAPRPRQPDVAAAGADEWWVDSVHWTGDVLLAVVSTETAEDWIAGVVSFDPAAWVWTEGALGPIDASLVDPVLADDVLRFMTEDRNDAFGGRYVTNATYDPTTDTWSTFDTGCPVNTRWATWTGEMIVEPYDDRRAFDPQTGECFRVPASKDRARQWEPVWTGREFLYWSGAYGDDLRGRPDGIAYRPPRRAVTDERAKPMGQKLRRAIKARRHYGFDTDPDVVREIMRDPWQPASREFGFPMTAAEESDIWARSGLAHAASQAQGWLRKLPTFAGLWQDQRAGGTIAIALTEADTDVIDEIDRRLPIAWRLVVVPRTERELQRALRRVDRVSKRLDPDAMLWAAGVDLSVGGLSLVYDPDDVKRMRARKKQLEQRLGVPVHISAGRVRDL